LLLTTKRTVTLLIKTRRPLNVIHGSARFAKVQQSAGQFHVHADEVITPAEVNRRAATA
jgi:hypothetical protein